MDLGNLAITLIVASALLGLLVDWTGKGRRTALEEEPPARGARAVLRFLLGALRHGLAVVALPFTVAVLIPLMLVRRSGVEPTWPTTPAELTLAAAALVLLAAGLALFASSVYLFGTRGRGTLAPWDPPRRLVVRGPYRFVRNPMISGVILVLFAQALALRAAPLAAWGATFFAINAVYIPLLEEPQLEQRFGDEYRRYKRHVPRLLPRLRPWAG